MTSFPSACQSVCLSVRLSATVRYHVGYIKFLIHYYRAMLAQSAVMRLHVVRLSVCL